MTTALHTTQVGGDTEGRSDDESAGGARIVFVHGLFGQGRNFTQIAKSLLLDLPDHGRSPWTEQVSYEGMADAVADTIRAWSSEPVELVGHSMGGKVAMLVALRHPELVDRLVVVDIAPDDSDGAGEFEHLLGSLAAVDLATIERRSDADEQLRGPIPNDTVRGFLLQNLRSTEHGYTWQANLDLLRRDLPVIAGFPHVDTTFDHPVLWVAGERSDYVRDDHQAEMRRLFPATRLVTIKGAGHWVHSEQPAAFVSALRVFLALR